jgi:hypothetical protein
MKVYIKSRKKDFEANGEFDITTKKLKIFKGSKVSSNITYSEKFKGAKTIEKLRDNKIKNNILQEDMIFKSPSTAANFVTGRSTNGLIAWKTEEGKKLKEVLSK